MSKAEAEDGKWSWGARGSLQPCWLLVTLLRGWWADQKNYSGEEAEHLRVLVRLKTKTVFSNKTNGTSKRLPMLLTPTPFYWQ